MKNNNHRIIRLLSQRLYTSNRRRNRILTAAVAISLFLLFSIFSIVIGRIQAEKLLFTRMAGTAATTYLEDATTDQAEQIAQQRYIKHIGMEHYFGALHQDQDAIATQIYTDPKTFDIMFRPAYTQIHGGCPEKEHDVLLSMRTLKMLGIPRPRIGMSIPLTDQDGRTEDFILCGFFTEFVDQDTCPPAFFSRKYFESLGNTVEQPGLLAICQKDLYTGEGETIENMLYRDVPTIDKAQQFVGGNSVGYSAAMQLVGGPDIGIACALLIVLCAGLLIYNVMALSLHREIRQYGLLNTLGATSGQLRRIVWRQVMQILAVGLLLGTILGGIFIFGFLPRLLEGKYLNGFGKASALLGFHPLLLLAAILFTAMAALLSSFMPIRRTGNMTPVDALRFVNQTARTSARKSRRTGRGNQIARMAWRNIFRTPKNALITLASLLLGFTVALGALVIVRGIDQRNELNQNDDFKLSADCTPFLSDRYPDTDACFFEDSFLEQIRSLDGMKEMKSSIGGYLRLDSRDAVWQPLLIGSHLAEGWERDGDDPAYAKHVRETYMAGYTVVDPSYIDALDACSRKYHLNLDVDGLRDGTCAIAFHFHGLSKQLEEESLAEIGKPFSIKTLDAKNRKTLQFGGYLNRSQKGLPPCETEISTSGYPTLLISQKCADRLGIAPKAYTICLNVDPARESVIKYKLNQMTKQLSENAAFPEELSFIGYTLQAKSDLLAEAEADLLPIRILMAVVSALLVSLGIFNYLNVTATSLEARKTEFTMLRYLGMTEKQLRQMLILEGLYYSALITLLLGTAGSFFLRGIYRLVKERIPYMQFQYPAAGLSVMLVLIYALCILLPLWMLRQMPGEPPFSFAEPNPLNQRILPDRSCNPHRK